MGKSHFRIFVDQAAIKDNERRGDTAKPPIVVIETADTFGRRVHAVEIKGPSRLVYDPKSTPRVWLETDGPIECG